MRRHGRVRMVAFMPIRAEPVFVPRLAMLHFEQERRAAMPVPKLRRIDAVPARHLSRLQQKENGGGMRAAMLPALVAERLAELPALGMRLEPELRDDLVGRCSGLRTQA